MNEIEEAKRDLAELEAAIFDAIKVYEKKHKIRIENVVLRSMDMIIPNEPSINMAIKCTTSLEYNNESHR